jgi:hypothetical protein
LGKVEKGMLTEIKYFIIFLIISLTPSELQYFSEGQDRLCRQQNVILGDLENDNSGFFAYLSEFTHSFIVKYLSENSAILTNDDDDISDTYKRNDHATNLCIIESSVCTVDWVSLLKLNLRKLLTDTIKKDFIGDELLPCQIYSNELFIPALDYYIYTLEEITI